MSIFHRHKRLKNGHQVNFSFLLLATNF